MPDLQSQRHLSTLPELAAQHLGWVAGKRSALLTAPTPVARWRRSRPQAAGRDRLLSGPPLRQPGSGRGSARVADLNQDLCADLQGLSLDAAARRGADDRRSLEQLCRYITLPALANEPVRCSAAGQVAPKQKTPWRYDTTHLVVAAGVPADAGRSGATPPSACDPLPRVLAWHPTPGCARRWWRNGQSRPFACTMLPQVTALTPRNRS
jgi:hypothetical protein